jgi:hypothetical protein
MSNAPANKDHPLILSKSSQHLCPSTHWPEITSGVLHTAKRHPEAQKYEHCSKASRGTEQVPSQTKEISICSCQLESAN